MAHIPGCNDADLHHLDGSHRSTPPTTNGLVLADYETRLTWHLYAHELQQIALAARGAPL